MRPLNARRTEPSRLIEALQRCRGLRHLWYVTPDKQLSREEAADFLEVQHSEQ
jgi:hypothetical protein